MNDRLLADDLSRPGGNHTAWGRSSPAVRAVVVVVVALVLLAVVPLSRYPEWDEAVFLSQSGGFEGVEADPSLLVASREMGTPALLAVLRLFSPSLANTRVLWMALSYAILALGVVLLSRTLQFPSLAGIALLSTSWLALSFSGSFFSFFIAASWMLVAAGLYLAVRASPRHLVVRGVGLGVSLAACLWFRQVEGAVFTAVLVLHSLAASPGSFWSRRMKAVGATALAFLFTFVVPWSWDSIQRFGSIGERLSSGREQNFGRGLRNQFGDYLASLSGQSQTYGSMVNSPKWAVTVLGVLLLALFGSSIWCVVSRRKFSGSFPGEDEVPIMGLSFLWAAAGALISFFMFYIEDVQDRYMLTGGMLLLIAMLATIWPVALGHWRRHAELFAGRRTVGVALVGLLVAWIAANSAVAQRVETARFDSAKAMQNNVSTIRALAEGDACHGVSRYGAPRIEFGTGCDVRSAATPNEAAAILESIETDGEFGFILWPTRQASEAREALAPDAETILLESRPGVRELVLHFRRPTGPQ